MHSPFIPYRVIWGYIENLKYVKTLQLTLLHHEVFPL